MTQTSKCLQSALVDTCVDISLGVIKSVHSSKQKHPCAIGTETS